MNSLAALLDGIGGGGPAGYVAVVLGGLVSSANPCVIGTMFLLIGFIGSYGAGRRRLWVWAAAFAAGTVVAFTGLGLVAARAGTILGLISPRWYLLLAALTAWMGLQTLGVLPEPSWATPGPGAAAGGKGGGGAGTGDRRVTWLAMLLGGLAAIILSPCATPVLIAVLGYAASRGGAEAVGLLAAYGVGRAFPLLLIGASSDLVPRLLARPGSERLAAAGRLVLGIGILLLSAYFLYLGL